MTKIKRIDLCILQTILNKVNTKGKAKRTNLALECKISYHRFIKYMCIMILLDLLVIQNEKEEIFVSITDLGRKFLKKYSSS